MKTVTILGEEFLFGLHLNLVKKIAPISAEDLFFGGGHLLNLDGKIVKSFNFHTKTFFVPIWP